MGEQQLDRVTSDELVYVPASEFRRLLDARLQPHTTTEAFAALARINTLYMIARAWSGHIGTSFSSLDIMSWLFLNEMRDLDRGPGACDIFFSSKGHDAPALYSVLIGLGLLPEEKVDNLRRLHGLPGHPHVETPYIQANTGSLGMGVSKAKGMAIANRLAGTPRRIFVLTGDGELQEGQFWESLASAANHHLAEIVVIVDHNRIQSDTWVEQVSDLGDVEAKLRAFGWHVARCDGHDVRALERTFRALDRIAEQPKVVIADTVKGKGVSFMEGPSMGAGDLYAYHSGAPTEAEYAGGSTELVDRARGLFNASGLGALATKNGRRPERREPRFTQNLISAYKDALVTQADRHPRLVVLDADLVKDCGLVPFAQKYPERFVECGIAEQDMVSMACGLAKRGALPVAHSFACFLSARPNEQIYNQCSEGSKVIYVGSLAGLLPGGPGHSHQSVRDIGALGSVPNLLMAEPSVENEVHALFEYLVDTAVESSYLRLVSVKWPVPFGYPAGQRVQPGRGWVVRDGRDLVVTGYGPWLLSNAWHAAEELQKSFGITTRLINLPWLNRVDSAWLKEAIGDRRAVLLLDNHYVRGGQGEMLAAAVAGLGLDPVASVMRLGVMELPECGTNDEVLAYHGLDVASLVTAFRTAVGRHRPGTVSQPA
ncbi:MAG: transketolase [Acidobacteria bacterium]|nr:transketolase [Acidobacteriota bacterium]